MSKEEIKEGLESIAGGSDKEPKKYPEIVKKYLGTVVPFDDNKFAALNSAPCCILFNGF